VAGEILNLTGAGAGGNRAAQPLGKAAGAALAAAIQYEAERNDSLSSISR